MFYIGIDDTDSVKRMCTTYLGALLADKLAGFSRVHPKLVRLNPNIKWKTRGNASVCLMMERANGKVKDIVLGAVKKYSEFGAENTHPGVVFFEGEIPKAFFDFYRRCLHKVVEIKEAEKLAEKYGAEIHKFKMGRGIVGALAAIGSAFDDRTYEIIAYRKKENWGKERRLDRASVYEMDAKTSPLTFNNVDGDRILITPHSTCPILFGIRGENRAILEKAYEMVKTKERIERKIIYETNQCTDAHLVEIKKISDAKPYSSVILKGTVTNVPKTIIGGHVIFSLSDGIESIDCAAYEPSRGFRRVVKKLRPGDRIVVSGAVRSDGKRTINLEKMQVLKLANFYEEENPVCKCGRRMESAGRGQDFRCRVCKTYRKKKIRKKVGRELEEKTYQAPPGSMRHLSKPLVRV